MNETINALYKEAIYSTVDYHSKNTHATSEQLNVVCASIFSELIIKECLNNMENCDGDLDFAIWKTMNLFGVKE